MSAALSFKAGDILLVSCKDPNRTKLKAKSHSLLATRPWQREPRVIIGVRRDPRRRNVHYIQTQGLITKRVKPEIMWSRAQSEGWNGWPADYRLIPQADWVQIHKAQVMALFEEN